MINKLYLICLLSYWVSLKSFRTPDQSPRRFISVVQAHRSYSPFGRYPKPNSDPSIQQNNANTPTGAVSVPNDPFSEMVSVNDGKDAMDDNDSTDDSSVESYYVSSSGTMKFELLDNNTESNVITRLFGEGVVSFNNYHTENKHPKPALFFLPGLDGLGTYSDATLQSLSKDYMVYKLTFTASDRSTFLEISEFVSEFIMTKTNNSTSDDEPYVIAGESFGGLLASFVATRLPTDQRKRLLLVNPATSYQSTVWPSLQPFFANVPPGLYPIIGISTLMSLAVEPSQFVRIGNNIISRINTTEDAFKELELLTQSADSIMDVLPQQTLSWRLDKWLNAGSKIMIDRYASLECPTLILSGSNDRLLPSKEEAYRLKRLLDPSYSDTPAGNRNGLRNNYKESDGSVGNRVEIMEVTQGGHALLDGSLDLRSILRKSTTLSDIYSTSSARNTAAGDNIALNTKSTSDALPLVDRRSFLDTNLSVPYPSTEDIEDIENRLGGFINSVSPVFLSTDTRVKTAKGNYAVRRGLHHVPTAQECDRPILFVGNHQLYGADLAIIIKAFLDQKSTLIRGLAHPLLFMQSPPEASSSLDKTEQRSENVGLLDEIIVEGPEVPLVIRMNQFRRNDMKRNNNQRGRPRSRPRPRLNNQQQNQEDFAQLFKKFGAVQVRADNLYNLLQSKENVLLFPGGVKEAYHIKGEEYTLKWPTRPDFIRMAALHNAIVVPFAGIGVYDSLNMLLDREDILNNPMLRQRALNAIKSIPQARATGGEQFIAPISIPKITGPARQYFLFGEPFDTAHLHFKDKALCKEAYQNIQKRVEDSIDILLKIRDNDKFNSFGSRLAYEGVFRTQAPVDLSVLWQE